MSRAVAASFSASEPGRPTIIWPTSEKPYSRTSAQASRLSRAVWPRPASRRTASSVLWMPSSTAVTPAALSCSRTGRLMQSGRVETRMPETAPLRT